MSTGYYREALTLMVKRLRADGQDAAALDVERATGSLDGAA